MSEKRTIEESTGGDSKRVKNEQVAEPKGIQETDVGITEYISKSVTGFQGVIKQRYTDFLVNEIDIDGNVLKFDDDGLGDLKRFRKENRQNKENGDDKPKEEEKKDEPTVFALSEDDNKKLLEFFPQAEIDQLIEMRNFKINKFESEVKFSSKEQRTLIHQLIRALFEGRIESRTSPNDTFQFSVTNKASRKPSNRVSIEDTLDENGVENYGLGPLKKNFCFNLYKQNKDTMEATNIIARMLRMNPKDVRFAGTKDRRGVTVQRCSIAKVKVERMNSLNNGLRGLIKIGGFSYSDEGVRLGDLKGNEFVVVVRDVKPLGNVEQFEDSLKEGFKALAENGFINYFGMQRFGTFSVSTHTIGKEILLSNWENACELILSDQELVIPDSKKSRKVWAETKNAKEASSLMPRRCVAESIILENLANLQTQRTNEEGVTEWKESDYFNAINRIPRNLKIMYGHAYQSYIWNCVTSRRLELFGSEVVVGDLVLDEKNETKDDIVEDEDGFQEDVRVDKFQRAKAVTEDDVKEGRYSIFDIVLPMPGFDIKYPENPKIMEIYNTVMGNDGLDPSDMVRKTKDFSFAGSYRKIVSKPKDLEFFLRHYDNPTQGLVRTDAEILENKRNNKTDELERVIEDKQGDKLAVILKFQLDTSCYATMMLREIMRMDTGRHGDLCDVKVDTQVDAKESV